MFHVLPWSCLCPIRWSRVLSREWRCSWSSADRRCSNYIWVIDNLLPTKVRLILETWRYYETNIRSHRWCLTTVPHWPYLTLMNINHTQKMSTRETGFGVFIRAAHIQTNLTYMNIYVMPFVTTNTAVMLHSNPWNTNIASLTNQESSEDDEESN